jgi:hypothetical protein
VFRELRKACNQAGTPDFLLEVTQSLLLIPTERVLAQPVWAGIAQFVGEATSNAVLGKKRSQKMVKLNYGVLHQILEERLKLDKNLAALASSDEVVARQRKKIEELTKQMADPRAQVESTASKALEEELKLARGKIAELQDEVEKLKLRLFEEQKKVVRWSSRACPRQQLMGVVWMGGRPRRSKPWPRARPPPRPPSLPLPPAVELLPPPPPRLQ